MRLEAIRRADMPLASELADCRCLSLDTGVPNCQHCSSWEIPRPQKCSEEVRYFQIDKLLLEMVLLNVSK